MSSIKYYYNPKTCKYERYNRSKWDILLNTLGLISLASVLSVGILIIFSLYFDSPKELFLKRENKELTYYYKILEEQVANMDQMLGDLRQRDDNLYRVIFETEPMSDAIRNAGIGGSDRFLEMKQKGLKKEKLLVDITGKVEKLKRKMYIQSVSYDEIYRLASSKDEYWAAVPAIQPIFNEDLNLLASGYGNRLHPILKVIKMHSGVDFAAPKGTPIYATGDGVVQSVRTDFRGYGKSIEIDHGFGFVTRYAHMNNFKVNKDKKSNAAIK